MLLLVAIFILIAVAEVILWIRMIPSYLPFPMGEDECLKLLKKYRGKKIVDAEDKSEIVILEAYGLLDVIYPDDPIAYRTAIAETTKVGLNKLIIFDLLSPFLILNIF